MRETCNFNSKSLPDFEKLPPKVRSAVIELEKATSKCTGFLVNICLSYGSRAEIVMACNSAIAEKHQHQADKMRREHLIISKDGELSSSTEDILGSDSCQASSSPVFSDNSDCTSAPSFDDVTDPDCSTAATDTFIGSTWNSLEDKQSSSNYGEETIREKQDRVGRSCSSSGASGNSDHTSVESKDMSSDEALKTNTSQSYSYSLQLDEGTLSRHMCTANIPGMIN